MPKALFISPDDLKRNSPVQGNVDTDKFIFFIREAQEIYIQDLLGTRLYNKIQSDILSSSLTGDYKTLVDDYIQPLLIQYALVDFLPWASITINNSGVTIHNDENSETASKSRIDFLVQKTRDNVAYRSSRLVDFLCFNESKYPEYNQNSNSDVYPSRNTNQNSGWVL